MSYSRLIRAAVVSAAVFSLSSLALAKETSYKINSDKSVVTWVGKKVAGSHNGTLQVTKGNVVMNDGKLKSGNFTLDMTSIKNNDLEGEWNTKLVNHLKSDDFFNVKKHPKGMFKTTKVVAGKGSQYTVTGDLTIKGIKKPVTFPLNIAVDKKGMATAKAKFKIDRLKWDIKYNSGKFFDPKKLGDKMIYDEIEIGLNLAAMPANMKGKKTAEKMKSKATKKMKK